MAVILWFFARRRACSPCYAFFRVLREIVAVSAKCPWIVAFTLPGQSAAPEMYRQGHARVLLSAAFRPGKPARACRRKIVVRRGVGRQDGPDPGQLRLLPAAGRVDYDQTWHNTWRMGQARCETDVSGLGRMRTVEHDAEKWQYVRSACRQGTLFCGSTASE